MFKGESELFNKVLLSLELAKSLADSPDPDNTQAVTAFSDSVVISDGGPFGTAGLLATVHVLAGQLLKQGILCRGGIAQGPTYHAEGIVFGEGLVRAYDLERNVAKMPRIVVAHDVAPSIFSFLDDPIPRFKRDEDGRLCVNVFNYSWKHDDLLEAGSLTRRACYR